MANFLNVAFAGYDKAILAVLHFFSRFLGWILTPLMKIVTFFGEGGVIFFLLALVLALNKKTRRTAVCLFGAVCCGALITNIILKDWVARPRPFEAVELFREWWESIGAPAEDGFSFPSGHITAISAAMGALCFSEGKKYLKPGIIAVLVMMIARNYLMVHYPSDALFSVIIGAGSAYIAWRITLLIFAFLEKFQDNVICDFMLNFSIEVVNLSALPKPDIKLPKLKDISFSELKKGAAKKGRHEK